jgi:glyoxalase family protein
MGNLNHQITYIEFSAFDQDSLRAAQEFYEQVFGWQYQQWGEDYIDTSDSGVKSGIAHGNENKPLAVIYTADLAATYADVKQAGATITADIFEFPGGRRFHFIDPAGNELAIWSDTA